MKNGKKKLLLPLTAAACALLLAGCGTSVGEHANTYFSQMGNVIRTAIDSARAEKEADSSPTQTVDANALAAPANFTVDENGNYSFDGVENAQYYYVYVYSDATGVEAVAQSEQIPENGSASYSGSLSDFANLTYQTWNVRVVAYPDYENSDYTASPEAKCDYAVSGAVEYGEPTFGYMWTVTSGELAIKIDDMDYGQTAYPTNIKITLTNTTDTGDVVTIDVTDISSSSVTATPPEASPDTVSDLTADFTWDENYVTNPSFSIQGGQAETDSTENLISGEFYYPSSIFKAFNFPHVQEDFDPVAGGLAGMWYNDGSESGGGWGPPGMVQEPEEEETDKSVYFEATPKQAENGALYSYNIMATSPGGAITASPKLSPGSGSTDRIFGTMDIFDDGTFRMEIEYQYISTDRMNSAVYYVPGVECTGVYFENADGTLTLSYDHENARETDYDIVTELTGQAAQYAAEHPEEALEEEQGGMPGGEGMPEGGQP